MPALNVTAIPAFTDNYIWLITTGGTSCAVIDPGAAEPVLRVLKERGLDLEFILITHHHADHTGGMQQLQAMSGAEIFGPHDTRISGQKRSFSEGEVVKLPQLGLEFEVLEVPGHTRSHIAFYGHESLFCGDTLFSAGCGRLFEGSPEQMQKSLDKLASLPHNTRVYCAHEYTQSNIDFALAVEPDNIALNQRATEVSALRSAGKPTIPSHLEEELQINPFLRSRQEDVVLAARKRRAGVQPGSETLAVIRAWKDSF